MSGKTELTALHSSPLTYSILISFNICILVHFSVYVFFRGPWESKYQMGRYTVDFLHSIVASAEAIFLVILYYFIPNVFSSIFLNLDDIKCNPCAPNHFCQQINAISLGYFLWELMFAVIEVIRKANYGLRYLLHPLSCVTLYWVFTFHRYSFIGAVFLYLNIASIFFNFRNILRVFYNNSPPLNIQPLYGAAKGIFTILYLICRLFIGSYLAICALYSVITDNPPENDRIYQRLVVISGCIISALSIWWGVLMY